MTASDHVRVVLEDVASTMSGSYLCEVTVTPTFFALAEAANMTVIGKGNRLWNMIKQQNLLEKFDKWLLQYSRQFKDELG